jgi:CubicO group peptidase (beta-lactamase class C family)
MLRRLSATFFSCLLIIAAYAPGSAWAQAATAEATGQYAAILEAGYPAGEPGAAALLARGGEVIFLGAAGLADLELGVSLEPDMVFEIGSITKQFTAAAIMMLAEEGELSVDDPITRHLPDYPSYGDDVTIEHLLTHTSGIFSYTDIPEYMQEVCTDESVDELIGAFKERPVLFQPGERWAYSNSNYVLLGAIIERVSEMSYAKFVEGRIFEPLGLDNSYYGSNRRIIPRRSSGYDRDDGRYVNAPCLSFSLPYAAGSLMMSVEDMYRWNRALYGGDVVSRASLERMIAPYVLANGDTSSYGYGLGQRDIRGHRAIGHGGGIFGFVTDAVYLPDDDVFVAVFSNNTGAAVNPSLIASKLAAAAIGDPYPEFTEITLDESVLRRYAGVYQIDENTQRVVTVENGALYTQRTGGGRNRAYPGSETHFFYRHSLSHFEFEIEDGEVKAMLMYQGGASRAERAVRVAGGE